MRKRIDQVLVAVAVWFAASVLFVIGWARFWRNCTMLIDEAELCPDCQALIDDAIQWRDWQSLNMGVFCDKHDPSGSGDDS